ncbi:uncharacterized protein [Anoplolepis gracilipes]|uniref:uncharacterized protein n=1 Tax=Anoplolepis gracilipes TaxID=354296 RepID=UPI003B9FAD5F
MLFGIHGEMIAIENQYYSVNRILLLICGLWPYENTKFRYVRVVFLDGILISFLIYQLIILFGREYNFKLVLKIGSDMLPIALCTMKFNAFLFNSRKVRRISDQINEDWNTLKGSEEIKIAKKYGKFMRRLTIILFLYTLSSLFIVMLGYIPMIVESAAFNKFLLGKDNNISETYLDKKGYIFFFITAFVAAFVVVTTITMILAYMRHICLMYKIACYRIENSFNEHILHMPIFQKEKIICRRLISAVNIHRKAIQFAEYTLNTFKKFYFVMIGVGVLSLAVSLLHTLQAILILDNINELMITVFYVILHFMFFFTGNYGGQMVTDHSADIATALLQVCQYLTSW